MNAWLEALSPDARLAFWTILVASLCSLMCAWLGVWLVLQRLSLIGDAISHAVLPGLALTFIWFGARDPLPMMIGAAAAGLLTTVLIRGLRTLTNVKEDAAMGVVFTILFALGVILITRYAHQIDLDPGCVLYGLIEFVALDTRPIAGMEVPSALINIVPSMAAVGVFMLVFAKELKLMAFDPRLAASLGFRPGAMNLALMAMVAIATVASFEAVGSILVIAMLIGPAATAQLLTRRLKPMFLIASGVAVASSALGYWSAAALNTSVAGMMSVAVGVLYTLAVVLSPEGGLLAQWLRRRRLAERHA